MYPYLRFFKTLVTTKSEGVSDPLQVGVLNLRVNIWDIDVYLELNNGRHLTLMDLGRFHLGKKAGLFDILKKRKWGLMVAGINSKYRHRLRYGQKFELHTKLIGYDERWFFFHQQIKIGEKVHSQALIKTAVTSKEGIVPSIEMLKELGLENWQPVHHEWILDWEQSSWVQHKV